MFEKQVTWLTSMALMYVAPRSRNLELKLVSDGDGVPVPSANV